MIDGHGTIGACARLAQFTAETPSCLTSLGSFHVDARAAALPLQGLRVLEMGQLIAGPFAGCILGYFGAEVIKVEPPVTAAL